MAFLTETGHKSDELRLEMMLRSDLLGLSALVDMIEVWQNGADGLYTVQDLETVPDGTPTRHLPNSR